MIFYKRHVDDPITIFNKNTGPFNMVNNIMTNIVPKLNYTLERKEHKHTLLGSHRHLMLKQNNIQNLHEAHNKRQSTPRLTTQMPINWQRITASYTT